MMRNGKIQQPSEKKMIETHNQFFEKNLMKRQMSAIEFKGHDFNWPGQAAGPLMYPNVIDGAKSHIAWPKNAKLTSLDWCLEEIGTAWLDASGVIIFANKAISDIWGDIEGRMASGLWHSPSAFQEILDGLPWNREWSGVMRARTNTAVNKIRLRIEAVGSGFGSSHWYVMTCIPDRQSEAKISKDILSTVNTAIIATNEQGDIIHLNKNAAQLFGYDEQELMGAPIHHLFSPKLKKRHAQRIKKFIAANGIDVMPLEGSGDVFGFMKDSSQFPVEASLSKFRSRDAWILVFTIRDLTEHRKAENDLQWRVTHDTLTDLPNRTMLNDCLVSALKRSKHHHKGLALVSIDLDEFKLINETHGHKVGDQLLIAIGNRLMRLARPGDVVARLGGDEFVILCESVNDDQEIPSFAELINETLREPIEIDGKVLVATASIGIAYSFGDMYSADDILRHADTAMYQVKEAGRDGWRIFNEGFHSKAEERLRITVGLRSAIQNNELQVRFQPIMNAHTGKIVGSELLVRWFPETGEVTPNLFIPVAESTGAILPIGRWVFEKACQAEIEQRALLGESCTLYISVNLSARQLSDPGLVDQFKAILESTGANPERLRLEITETSLMTDVETNLKVLEKLSDIGLRVAVDDFGTGYSSLSQLLRLPVDCLKIDRIFVDGLTVKKESKAIVSAIINMADALDLRVIAEGVETDEQLTVLRDMGCSYFQGFHFFRPMSQDDYMAKLLES